MFEIMLFRVKLDLRVVLHVIALLMMATAVLGQPADQLKRASELFKSGVEKFQKGQYDAAIVDYTEYLKIRPTVASAWFNRALAYKQKADLAPLRDDFERAEADLTRAIKLNATDVDYWLNRGFVRLRLIVVDFNKYVPLAAADFTKAIRLKPNLSDAYTGRAQVYQESNRNAESMADANKALQLNPDDYVALFLRAKLNTYAQNFAAARTDLEKAIKLYPDYTAAKSQLSYVISESQKKSAVSATKTGPVSKAPAVAIAPANSITDAGVGFKLADEAEKAGDHRKVIDVVTKTLPLIAMQSEGVPVKEFDEFVYLDLVRKRAKAYLALKLYKEAQDEYTRAVSHAIKNMNRHNEKANEEASKDRGSGGGLIMATVQTASSTIICKSTFTAVSEWSNTLDRERPNDMTLRFTSSIYMGAIREACATSYYMEGTFEEMKSHSNFGNSVKTKQLTTAIERYTTAIQYLQVFREAYVARSKAYRDLGRNDLAIADEQKAATLPVK